MEKVINTTVVRYLLVGGTAFVMEMLVLLLLISVGLDDILAVSFSFWIGFFAAFVMQKILTFRNSHTDKKNVATQLVAYSLLVAWNYIFTLLIVGLFSDNVKVYLLRAIVIAITTVWNYFIYKRIFSTSNTT